jgi:hypothetical protein
MHPSLFDLDRQQTGGGLGRAFPSRDSMPADPFLTSTLFRRTVYAVMAYKALTVEELLGLMKKIQGEKTNTQFAAEIGMSKQYLTDIYNGRKVPSDTVSAALGYTPRVETRYLPSVTAANEESPRAAPTKSKATRSRKRDSR